MLHDRPQQLSEMNSSTALTRSALCPSTLLRSPFDRLKSVLVADLHRLRGECLARLIGDHCPDLIIRIAPLDEAYRAGLFACAPDLVIVHAHRRELSELDLVDSLTVPTIVIGKVGARLGAHHAMVFPPEGGVCLLIAAVRLALAGGRFIPHEHYELQTNH